MKRIVLFVLIVLVLVPSLAAAQTPTQTPWASGGVRISQSVRDKIKAKGKTGFWVVFGQQPDLSGAAQIQDWTARGEFVVQHLQVAAHRSQADVLKALKQRKTRYTPFWIVNAIHVPRGDQQLLDELALQRGVVRIEDERTVPLPPVTTSPLPEMAVAGIEWNVSKVRAPEVWNTYNVRGEGIVVGSIDTGVQFNHPALVRQYRGRLANGAFDHNYNWFDPSRVCAPATVPCDNHGHGSHVTGTMTGDDGTGNQIGLAPAARWIAAKGCEVTSTTSGCSDAALLAAGQWMLAPTDLGGKNPRADLRPHIINNSWGGDPLEAFYKDVVKAWIAAGIFPVFSNGNTGPGCETVGAPGSYTETYAVGAFDQTGQIASFSSRGKSTLDGVIKPNIAAPGVAIRSALNNNAYVAWDGTSMAAPHVAGAIALLWSASSTLMGDVAATRSLLDGTAIDVNDTSCGGTAANNNVWGQGKLDVYTAVSRAARDTKGTLQGTVTDQTSGAGILGATIAATGPLPQKDNRVVTSGTTGAYRLQLPTGTYNVTISGGFGYSTQTLTNVAITAGSTTTRNIALAQLPRYTVSGTVRDVLGQPLSGVRVSVGSTPIAPVTTATNGTYTITGVPQGTYLLQAEPGRCNVPTAQQVTVASATTTNFALSQQMDAFGYTCQTLPGSFVAGTTKLPIGGRDAKAKVTLPFPFRFYGKTYSSAYVTSNGYLSFLDHSPSNWSTWLPYSDAPNAVVYALWDQLDVDASAGVYTMTRGTAPNREFVIEWRNVRFVLDGSGTRGRFAAILHENGRVTLQYADVGTSSRDRGDSATVGLENESGTIGFQYSYHEAVLSNAVAIRFVPPVTNVLRNPGFESYVFDANYNFRPANWTMNASFQYDPYDETGRRRSHSGIHTSTTNSNAVVQQQVGVVAGQRYSFVGWVNIPPTQDAFSFKIDVVWRNAANATLSTQTIKTYTGATVEWDEAASNALVAPTGATNALIRMSTTSLNGTIYVDDFIFGR